MILWSLNSASYQRSEKPVKRPSWRVLLKLNSTMNSSGVYKKAYPSTSQKRPK